MHSNSLLHNVHGLRWFLTLSCSQAGARSKYLSLVFQKQRQSSHQGEAVCTCVGTTKEEAPQLFRGRVSCLHLLWFYTPQSKVLFTQWAQPSYKVQTCFSCLLPEFLSLLPLINSGKHHTCKFLLMFLKASSCQNLFRSSRLVPTCFPKAGSDAKSSHSQLPRTGTGALQIFGKAKETCVVLRRWQDIRVAC